MAMVDLKQLWQQLLKRPDSSCFLHDSIILGLDFLLVVFCHHLGCQRLRSNSINLDYLEKKTLLLYLIEFVGSILNIVGVILHVNPIPFRIQKVKRNKKMKMDRDKSNISYSVQPTNIPCLFQGGTRILNEILILHETVPRSDSLLISPSPWDNINLLSYYHLGHQQVCSKETVLAVPFFTNWKFLTQKRERQPPRSG